MLYSVWLLWRHIGQVLDYPARKESQVPESCPPPVPNYRARSRGEAGKVKLSLHLSLCVYLDVNAHTQNRKVKHTKNRKLKINAHRLCNTINFSNFCKTHVSFFFKKHTQTNNRNRNRKYWYIDQFQYKIGGLWIKRQSVLTTIPYISSTSDRILNFTLK